MAKKILTLPYTDKELVERLEHPIWQVYDVKARLYRYFGSKQDYDEATKLLDSGQTLSAELLLREHHHLTAPAPYTCSLKNYTDNVSILEGTKGNYLEFEFQTIDGNGVLLNETVEITYTFVNNGVSQQTAGVYTGGTKVRMLIDNYLKSGSNSITIIARGRTSQVNSSPLVLTWNVVSIGISSTFSVAQAQKQEANGNVNMLVTYHTWGAFDKNVEFYIDSQIVSNLNQFISASNDMTEDESVARSVDISMPLTPGKHTLQMRTRVMIGDEVFYTKTLYYEFVVTGVEQTVVNVAQELPSGHLVDDVNPLMFEAEQYVMCSINWGYYTSKVSGHTATVNWRLVGMDGESTSITTTDATVIDATNNILPDPVTFAPESYGKYTLEAVVKDVVIGSYTINIVKNRDGVEEYRNGLALKLSATGRGNSEPEALRSAWEFKNADGKVTSTSFNGFLWNSVNGWQNNALVCQAGANAVVNMQPLTSPQDTGFTFEVTFETFAVSDDNAPLLWCNNGEGGMFAIYGTKAVMRSRLGSEISTEFQSGVTLTLAFVVNPSSASGLSSEPNLMFIQTNGIRERSRSYAGANDTFNSSDSLHIGDPEGRGGIKIYNIRTYNRAIGRNEEANNYILGSGNITQMITKNDVLTNGVIDIDKLTSLYDTIAITAPIDRFFNSTSKDKLYGNAWRKNPNDPRVNFEAIGCEISHPGQSTLGFSKPQLRLNFNAKKACVLYNADGKITDDGYYSITFGQIPEKKVRLNPNFVDSTCANALGFFNMVNDLYPKTQVGNSFVLRNAQQNFVANDWERRMGVPFPYKVQNVPSATPVVLIWRPDERADWSFLSVFTLLDEKKSPRKFGQRSIYNCADDPYLLETKKSEGDYVRIWDNADCLQYEIQQNADDLALFKSVDNFYKNGLVNEEVFEREYPDPDDMLPEEMVEADDRFYRFVSWVVSCKNNQLKFDNEWRQYLNPYFTAAYWVLLHKLGMVDNSVRNMDLRTDDGTIWYPIWWDTDVQKGKRNDGLLVFPPRTDRHSLDPSSTEGNVLYAFAGHDSVLLNLLEGCREFQDTYVPQVNQGLYNAGLDAKSMMSYYRKATDYYNIRLYNESIQNKYIDEYPDKDYLAFNAGNGENHDLWWVADSFQYWDARWSSASYASKSIYLRLGGCPSGKKMYFKAAKENYYMWALTDLSRKQLDVPVHAMANEDFYFQVQLNGDATLGINDPALIYGVNSLAEADFHEVARYMSAALQFAGTYDDVLGSNLRKLVVGISKEDMRNGIFNQQEISFTGLNTMDVLNYFDVQGQRGLTTLPEGTIDKMTALKTFLAAGSNLAVFSPAPGADLTLVELPDRVRTLQMTDVTWGELKFYNDSIVERTAVPHELEAIYFYNMGSDDKVKQFVLEWLHEINNNGANFSYRHLTLTNLLWSNVSIADILLLAKIPSAARQLSGSITTNEVMTAEQYETIVDAFGENVFSHGAAFIINAPTAFIIGGKTHMYAGETQQIKGVAFPIADGTPDVEYSILGVDPSRDREGNMVYMTKNCILYAATGRLVTNESQYDTHSITIRGINYSTSAYAEMTIQVETKVYPTAVAITGQTEIMSTGLFEFTPQFTVPEGVLGTQSGYEWEISGGGTSVRIDSETMDKLSLYVAQMPESDEGMDIYIDYKAMFPNLSTITAEQFRTIIIAVRYIMFAFERPVIMQQMAALGYSADPNRMTNLEARMLLELPPAIAGNSGVTEFPEIRFFANLIKIDLHDTGLSGDFDLTLNTKATEINLSGTEANPSVMGDKLRTLKLGVPESISIDGCTNLSTFEMDSALVLDSIDMTNMNA